MVESSETRVTLQGVLSVPGIPDLDYIASLISADPSSLHMPNEAGSVPIQVAAYRGHSGLIRVIAEHGADLEVRDAKKQTPLLVACQVGG